MRQVDRQALVPFSAQQMFDLVDDVASYPAFLPWCKAATVLARSPGEVVAMLQIHKGALHARFTTRNTLDPPRSIRLALVEGPFKSLDGGWKFEPIADKIELTEVIAEVDGDVSMPDLRSSERWREVASEDHMPTIDTPAWRTVTLVRA